MHPFARCREMACAESRREDFLRDYVTVQKEIWTSPGRMDRRAAVTRALPLVAGTAALIAVDRKISRGLPNTPDQIRWSNRVSHAGGLYTVAAASAPHLLAGKLGGNRTALDIGWSSAEALAAAVSVNYAMKYPFGRERPDQGAGNGPFFRGGDSFPSGYTMSTWAVCTVIAKHPRTPTWVRVLSSTVAVSVSLSRIAAQRHFASDVFAGAFAGGLIGNYVASRSR
jgi:membrane-associated phospholipid phosphatase